MSYPPYCSLSLLASPLSSLLLLPETETACCGEQSINRHDKHALRQGCQPRVSRRHHAECTTCHGLKRERIDAFLLGRTSICRYDMQCSMLSSTPAVCLGEYLIGLYPCTWYTRVQLDRGALDMDKDMDMDMDQRPFVPQGPLLFVPQKDGRSGSRQICYAAPQQATARNGLGAPKLASAHWPLTHHACHAWSQSCMCSIKPPPLGMLTVVQCDDRPSIILLIISWLFSCVADFAQRDLRHWSSR